MFERSSLVFCHEPIADPMTDAELDGVVQLVEQARSQGASFHDAMRMGLARVLCSPGFLFIQEPPIRLQADGRT